MTIMKFHELIDMSIGFPEPGHVNFSALHCLLTCITEKLGITNEIVNYFNTEEDSVCGFNKYPNYVLLQKSRMSAGSNPNEDKDYNIEDLPGSKGAPIQESDSTDLIVTNATIDKQDIVDTEIYEKSSLKEVEEEIGRQTPFIELENSLKSKESIESHKKPISFELSISKLNKRISKIETTLQKLVISENISQGLAVMKDQLEFVMDQLLLLTFITLDKKTNSQQLHILYSMSQTLSEIKGENIYIEGSNKFQLPKVPSLNWLSSNLQLNENTLENDLLEAHITTIKATPQDELVNHVCYSPSKLLDELMEVKSEFCVLTNKVNELSSRVLQQENQRTLTLIREMQDQMREVKLTTISLNENQNRVEARVTNNLNDIENIKRNIDELVDEKVNKTDLEIKLADKVDYKQMQRKVSLDQILELQCRIDKKFCDILRQIKEIDIKFSHTIDDLKTNLGIVAIEEILKTFKDNITKDINALNELLKNYMESTNDDCAAAGARIKVIQDHTCLSCDKDCVMRTIEKSKLAKLPNAYSSNTLSPLITYELGSIRKSGIMGYYHKDEFPHAINAWSAKFTKLSKDVYFPRHAGGQHTTNNAKERIKKLSNKK